MVLAISSKRGRLHFFSSPYKGNPESHYICERLSGFPWPKGVEISEGSFVGKRKIEQSVPPGIFVSTLSLKGLWVSMREVL
jgi:hypothetical protein